MAILKQVKENFESNNWLLNSSKNITSQCGEDGILEKIFEVIGESNRWCVEFGAWDGKLHSNTYNLLMNKHWKGVLIEANPAKFNDLVTTYQQFPDVHCFNMLVEFYGPQSLDSILTRTKIPQDFDLLSIDVDGNDYHLWDSVKDYDPKVVIVEFNPTIPNDIIFVQDKNPNLNHGSSLLAMIVLGKKKQYELVCATQFNAIFVRQEYYHLFQIKDNSINKMYNQQPFATKIFQLYDGTLVLGGVQQLIWSGIPITTDDIQVIPRSMRVFKDKV